MTAKLPTRRVNHGKGHSYYVDGRRCDGVTTLLSKGVPKNLSAWAAGEGARYVLDHHEMVGSVPHDDIIDLARKAPFATRDAAALKGTAVHDLAERTLRGEDVKVPDEYVGHVDQYLDWIETWQPHDDLVERMIVNRRHRYAGTFDLVSTLPALGVTLVDVKTGKSGAYGETALQLVSYGHAETYLDDDGTERPMPAIDAYAVLHLESDAWTMYRYDIGEREFRVALYAFELARWIIDRCDWKSDNYVRSNPLAPPARPALVAS